MENRRQFIKKIMTLFSGLTTLSGILPPFLRSVQAKELSILPANGYMDKNSLKQVSQNQLASRKIRVTPLKSFGVMGATDIKISKDEWNLEIDNNSGRLIKYTYDEILNFPVIEKHVVLTCPGFFQNQGLWKGFSIGLILEENGLLEGVNEVEFFGMNGRKDKSYKFPVKSVLNDHTFLAYEVNRETLPMRNGFPLRVVAQNYSGGHWIKYVNKITLIK